MKSFACVLLMAAIVAAEPPRYRQARFRSEQQEAADSEGEGYPAAGFKPSKEFKLPSRQEVSPPATSYGVPAEGFAYQAPQMEYGVPEVESRENRKGQESETENAESRKKEEKKERLEEEPKNDAEVVSAQGAYYVLLPNSQLQRVQFQTENDLRNMAYTARLQYRSEDRAPIYVYTAVPQYQSAAYIQFV